MNYLIGVLALPAAMAWWDGGHYISGAIARQTLLEQGKTDAVEWIEKILALNPEVYGKHDSFLTAPTWLDDVKSSYRDTDKATEPFKPAISVWSSNHFMNIPVENDCHGACITEPLAAMTEYLAQGYNQIDTLLAPAFSHLAPEGSTRHPGNFDLWSTQLHLRWLMHLIGDAHMPMHMTGIWHRGLWECPSPCTFAWCTDCKEHSDHPDAVPGKTYLLRNHHCNGGNHIRVKYDEKNWPQDMDVVDNNNLHGFWDSMGGFAQGYASSLTDKEKEALAEIVMKAYPFDDLKSKFNIWGNNWTLRRDVYPYVYNVSAVGAEEDEVDGQRWYAFMDVDVDKHLCMNGMSSVKDYCETYRSLQITEAYRAFTEKASKRLVALAGYRMADALNRVVEGLTPKMKQQIDARLKEQGNTSGAASLLSLGATLLATGAFVLAH